MQDDLWSARVLMDDPGAVEAVHLSYYRAGKLCQSSVAATLSFSLLMLSQLSSPWCCQSSQWAAARQ